MIETRLGKLTVRRPDLRGWDGVCKAIPRQAYDGIWDALLMVMNVPDGPEHDEKRREAYERAGRIVLGLLQYAPAAMAALLAAMVRAEDGRRITPEQAMELDDVDAERILRAAHEAGFLSDLARRAGNWLRRARGAA